MSIIKKIKTDFHIINPIYPLCAGTGITILGLVTLISSNCHPIYQWILLPRGALPYWLFALTGIIMFFLLGATLGLFFDPQYCKQKIYLPILMLLSDIVLTMVWYHMVFISFRTLIAIAILILTLYIEFLIIRYGLILNSLIIVSSILICSIKIHYLWLNIGINFLN